MVIDIPALHRMEYIYSFIINNVVKDFKRVAIPIKTDKQIFVFCLPPASIKPAIIFGGVKRPADIRPGYVMFKGGGAEFNGNIHVSSILPVAARVNLSHGATLEPAYIKSFLTIKLV
jgi:hypothetical protein